jgi:hypothetical protein
LLRGCCRQRYNQGRTESPGSSACKIKKGDIVRCDLDMDAGTLSCVGQGWKLLRGGGEGKGRGRLGLMGVG